MYNSAVMETVGNVTVRKLTGVNQLRSSIKFTQYSWILEERTHRKIWLVDTVRGCRITYNTHIIEFYCSFLFDKTLEACLLSKDYCVFIKHFHDILTIHFSKYWVVASLSIRFIFCMLIRYTWLKNKPLNEMFEYLYNLPNPGLNVHLIQGYEFISCYYTSLYSILSCWQVYSEVISMEF